MKVRRWSLERFVQLEVDIKAEAGWGIFLILGPLQWVWCYLFDWLFPWLGGRYRLWLRSARKRRILAWQGNSDEHFQTNLRHLESVTGLKVHRTGWA